MLNYTDLYTELTELECTIHEFEKNVARILDDASADSLTTTFEIEHTRYMTRHLVAQLRNGLTVKGALATWVAIKWKEELSKRLDYQTA